MIKKLKFCTYLKVLLLFIATELSFSKQIDSFVVSVQAKDSWIPSVITDLQVEIIDNRFKLSWTAPTENYGLQTLSAVSGYYVAYSTVSLEELSFDTTAWWELAEKITLHYANNPGQLESFVFPVVKFGFTYYFAIRSFDDASPPNVSAISNIVKIKVGDKTPPMFVVGLKGTLSSDMKTFRIEWSKVTRNIDGSMCDDLYEYRIYRSVDLGGEYILRASVSADETNWIESENIKGKVYFYYVTAVDTSGNESDKVMIVDSSLDMKVYFVSKDTYLTHLTADFNSRNQLYAKTSRTQDDVYIDFEISENNEHGVISKVYSLTAKRSSNLSTLEDFYFDDFVKLSFFVDSNGTANTNEFYKNVSIFWFNGLRWLKIAGDINPYFKTISLKTKRVGKYMLKLSARPQEFTIVSIQPDKIFTPNEDGLNDVLEIIYDNPKDATVVGKVYNVKGYYIADMKKGYLENSLIWDGKDNNGNYVPGGIYIYQIELSGSETKIINGTCVVGR